MVLYLLVCFVIAILYPSVAGQTATSSGTNPSIQIWVGEGLVDCGSPLESLTCFWATTPITTSAILLIDQDGGTDYFDCSSSSLLGYFPHDTCVVFTINSYSLYTNIPPYTPSIIDTTFPMVTTFPTSVPTPATTGLTSSQDTQADWYPLCTTISGFQFTSNFDSLTEVCQLVGNFQETFVSLVPTSAAYMPTWIDYLMSTIFSLWGFGSAWKLDESVTIGWFGWIGGIFSCLFAITRTSLAITRLNEHVQSNFAELPFISPMIWSDWVFAAAFAGHFSVMVGTVLWYLALIEYCVCFWLCIGYGHLGYGVRQYYVVNVPPVCQYLADDSWQTDPRRIHFVGLHVAIFAMGSFVFFGLSGLFTRLLQTNRREFHAVAQLLPAIMAGLVLLPTIGGAIYVGVANEANYLMLKNADSGGESCFASYLSGRYGYLNIEIPQLERKVATWFGLNV